MNETVVVIFLCLLFVGGIRERKTNKALREIGRALSKPQGEKNV